MVICEIRRDHWLPCLRYHHGFSSIVLKCFTRRKNDCLTRHPPVSVHPASPLPFWYRPHSARQALSELLRLRDREPLPHQAQFVLITFRFIICATDGLTTSSSARPVHRRPATTHGILSDVCYLSLGNDGMSTLTPASTRSSYELSSRACGADPGDHRRRNSA